MDSIRVVPLWRRVAVLVAALVAVTLAASTTTLGAQATPSASGRVVGRIVDASTGQGLSDVSVQVVGTTIGTASGVDGRFTLNSVPSGTIDLRARRIGYAAKTVTGIELAAGGTVEQSIVLETATVQLATQIVTASAERGTVAEALDEQRTATGIVNSVTREQIARSPDSDAGQAVQRVSGVTVQDGKYVFVRGLGERYTTTSLNGARLPSPEPERRVVPLDLFPTSLLQSVSTSKNFTPDQPGDFSGAQVDLRTREFPGSRQVAVSLSSGYNLAATGQTVFAAPGGGLAWLGFAGADRQLPAPVAAAGSLDRPLLAAEANQLVNSFRNAWSARERAGSPNTSASITVGGNDPVFGRNVGYVGSLSYQYAQEIRENEVRAYAEPTGGSREVDRFEGSTGRNSVLWGGMVNLSTMVGTGTRLSFNNTYNRTSDNEARNERGFSENLGTGLIVDRLRFVERTIRSNQLAAAHQIGSNQRVDWSLTSSGVMRSEPDRSEFVYTVDGQNAPIWLDASEAAVRTFGDLSESNYNAAANYTIDIGNPARQHQVKFGGLYRYTDRDAINQVYSLQSSSLTLEQRQLRPEQIFDGRFSNGTQAGFRVVPLSQGGSYAARDILGAGYGMVEYQLTERIRTIAGARLEFSDILVDAQPTVGQLTRANPQYTDILPSLVVNFNVSPQQNLRVSATQTLSRPEYRELAQVQYRDVIGAENVLGNPELERTLIQNADVRWEWYPNPGEIFSVGVFAKRFVNPIERVFLATSGTRVVTFVNAKGADNVGIELEARKGLGFVADRLEPLSVFTNLTLMRSEIRLGDDARVADEDRAMVGQAPYVVNAGLTYSANRGLSATVLYNRVGRRIVSASQFPLPVTFEESRDMLDFSLRVPLIRDVVARFDAKNLLNPVYKQTQGTVTRESFTVGRIVQLGLTWSP